MSEPTDTLDHDSDLIIGRALMKAVALANEVKVLKGREEVMAKALVGIFAANPDYEGDDTDLLFRLGACIAEFHRAEATVARYREALAEGDGALADAVDWIICAKLDDSPASVRRVERLAAARRGAMSLLAKQRPDSPRGD